MENKKKQKNAKKAQNEEKPKIKEKQKKAIKGFEPRLRHQKAPYFRALFLLLNTLPSTLQI